MEITLQDLSSDQKLSSYCKFCGINGMDHAFYESYLDNRCFKIPIYNDIDDSNKVSIWANVRHGVPQGSVLGPLHFLLCINDLSKINNRTHHI